MVASRTRSPRTIRLGFRTDRQPHSMNLQPIQGLSHTEVQERVAQGLVNRVRRSDAAEYLDIVQRNLLTLFNALVFPAAVLLFLLGDYPAGLAVSGMAIANTLLGLVQEIRAKKQLDQLTLLAETRVRVIRDSKVEEIPAGDVVQGDFLLLSAGDTVVADGEIVESRYLEIDEALLTGESDPVSRKLGEQVLSGSFCVTGEGVYIAQRVGQEAFAQKTASEARAYQYTASPLQDQINRLIRILTSLAVLLSCCYLALYYLRGTFGVAELVRMVAATITSMVPQGLVLMATIALLLGAVAMTARRVIVNRLSAVEAMSSIDTLCMDKTGTLTTNRLKLAKIEILDHSRAEKEVNHLLALFAWNSLDRDNKNLIALREAFDQVKADIRDHLPFKSQNRYSALRVNAESEQVLALGAWEALQPLLVDPKTVEQVWQPLISTGWRLLVFAEAREVPRASFDGSLQGFRLHPLAVLALSDELRPEAAEVLRQFAEQGIQFKILSGDNPETVRATLAPLAESSDHPALRALACNPVLTGAELEATSTPKELIDTHSVFGRVSPWQKVQIVRALRAQGRKVAMIGDGVNDVLPIKSAHLGVAMGEGSRAAQTVAGVVLQTNDFSLLPRLLDEGRIIVRNLQRSGKLFLTKNAYTLLLIVGTLGIFNLSFPFLPQQVTLLNFLTIGVPAFLITLDRSRASATHADFVREVGGFALRTGLISGSTTLGLMLLSARSWHDEVDMQRTLVLSTLILLGWVTLWRVLGSAKDRLLRSLPLPGLAIYLTVMYLPVFAEFFKLEPLDPLRWGAVGVTVTLAWVIMSLSDRLRPTHE